MKKAKTVLQTYTVTAPHLGVRIVRVEGTRVKVTLRQPGCDYRNPKHSLRNIDGTFDRWLDDDEIFDLKIADITSKLDKCTGKHRRLALTGGTARKYPMHGGAMNTRDYVREYFALNKLSFFGAGTSDDERIKSLDAFFELLSTAPQAWPDEPLFESIENDLI